MEIKNKRKSEWWRPCEKNKEDEKVRINERTKEFKKAQKQKEKKRKLRGTKRTIKSSCEHKFSAQIRLSFIDKVFSTVFAVFFSFNFVFALRHTFGHIRRIPCFDKRRRRHLLSLPKHHAFHELSDEQNILIVSKWDFFFLFFSAFQWLLVLFVPVYVSKRQQNISFVRTNFSQLFVELLLSYLLLASQFPILFFGIFLSLIFRCSLCVSFESKTKWREENKSTYRRK